MSLETRHLYRAVESHYVAAVLQNGLTGDRMTYWGDLNVATYYAEAIADEGHEPVILRAALSAFDHTAMEPDYPGIEEPLVHTLRMNEETVWNRWTKTDQNWQACLDLIGSVRYRGILTPQDIETVPSGPGRRF